MKKRKIVAMCLAAVCAASLFGGCGGQKQADNEKITLTLWNRPAEDAMESIIESNKRFEEAIQKQFPDINFEFKTPPAGGADYRQEYDKALMAGTAPAYFSQFSYTDIPARLENGTVADITKYVENWDLKNEGKILDVFDNAISKDGKWYALPLQAYTKATMANLKTIEAAGGDVNNLPATWDEFAKFGAEVTDLSIPRIGYSLIGMDWCAWPFTAWVWSAGGEMVEKNSDGTYRIAFNDPEGVDAAEFINNMIWKYKMTQKDVLADIETVNQNMKNGTACFAWLNLNDVDAEKLSEYDLKVSDFSQMAMPVKDKSIKRPALAGGEVITFNPKLSEAELDAAVEVAKWVYFSDERMQVLCDEITEFKVTSTTIPGRVDWYEKKLDANTQITDKQKEEFVTLSENAKPEPYCAHWTEIKSELVAPLQKIYLTDGITRDEIQALLDECADKLYGLYPDTLKKQ